MKQVIFITPRRMSKGRMVEVQRKLMEERQRFQTVPAGRSGPLIRPPKQKLIK